MERQERNKDGTSKMKAVPSLLGKNARIVHTGLVSAKWNTGKGCNLALLTQRTAPKTIGELTHLTLAE